MTRKQSDRVKLNIDSPGDNAREIEVAVVRTRRKKSISIEVREGAVRVLVPRFTGERSIAKLLAKNRAWIERKLTEQSAFEPYVPKSYRNGEVFPYLGRHYWLNLSRGETDVRLDGMQLAVNACEGDDVRILIEDWYTAQAKQHLGEATAQFSENLGVEVRSVAVKNYKSRWGSCSINGDIRYNWRAIMAPYEVVEYLAAHEVAHRKHHDHSKAYWSVVESLVPDYKIRRAWLKDNGHTLRID